MRHDERIAGERLEAYWDQILAGSAPHPDTIDPEDAHLITALHRLHHPQRPSAAFRRRLRGELTRAARASGQTPVVSVMALHDRWEPPSVAAMGPGARPERPTAGVPVAKRRPSWLLSLGITGLAALLLAWGVSAISQQRFVDGVAHDLITLSAPLQVQAPGWSFIRAITGGTADPVRSPSGAAVAPDGRIYVIDTARDQIRVLDAAGQPVIAWGESGSDPGQFWFSVSDGADLALAPDGSLVVIDPANNRVQQFTSDGTLLRTWGGLGGDPGRFLDPYGVAVDRDGRIYVADYTNHRIQVFDHDGRFLAGWDGTKGGDTPLAGPVGVAVAPDGTIWVTDDILQRVIGFHPDGTVASAFGSIGDDPGQVRGPWGIAVDAAGLLYVAEYGNDRVQVFTPEGTSVAILGTAGTAAGTLSKPTYIAFGPEGTLYVSSEGTHRLQEFRIIADDKER